MCRVQHVEAGVSVSSGEIGSPCPRCGAPGVLHRPCERLFCNNDDCEFSWKRHLLAAEAVVLPRLGIHFEERTPGMTLRAAAEVQGVPDQVFWRAFGSSAARELGMRMLHYLLRRCGCGRRS